MTDPAKLDLVACALSDFGHLSYRYQRGILPVSDHPLLVVTIDGKADNHENETYSLAAAIIIAGLEAWEPFALVLDLRGLDYSWGDAMSSVLGTASRWYEPHYPIRAAFGGDKTPKEFPMAVVTSDLNREGLESLVRDYMNRDPAPLLYQSFDAAVRYLDDLLKGVGTM
jgi:hypothetical protein